MFDVSDVRDSTGAIVARYIRLRSSSLSEYRVAAVIDSTTATTSEIGYKYLFGVPNLLHIDNRKTCDKLGSLANSAAYFELSTDAFNSLSQTGQTEPGT